MNPMRNYRDKHLRFVPEFKYIFSGLTDVALWAASCGCVCDDVEILLRTRFFNRSNRETNVSF